MAISTKMKKTGKTVETYTEFVEKNKQALIKMGYTEDQATEQSEMICGMYKHTFAEMKEIK